MLLCLVFGVIGVLITPAFSCIRVTLFIRVSDCVLNCFVLYDSAPTSESHLGQLLKKGKWVVNVVLCCLPSALFNGSLSLTCNAKEYYDVICLTSED